jgi:hypothetical protein
MPPLRNTPQVPLPEELAWIPALVQATYFLPCPNHVSSGKAELTNIFHIADRSTSCPSCATARHATDIVQVLTRRAAPHPYTALGA